MGTKLLISTAFHPQTDGAMEHMNCSIGQLLWTMIHNDQKNWAEVCPMVEFVLNSHVSLTNTMGYAPFKFNCGYIPQLEQHWKIGK